MNEPLSKDLYVAAMWARMRLHLRNKGFLSLVRRACVEVARLLGWDIPYLAWVKHQSPSRSDLAAQRGWSRTARGLPVFALIIRLDEDSRTTHARTLRSLRRQTYPHWSIVDVGIDADRSALASSLREAGCDYVGIMRAGDTLSPDALYQFARVIVDRDPRPDALYCDEDHLARDGRTRSRPIFKPSWSPEMLLSYHYTGRLTLARWPLVNEVGGFDPSLGEAAEWDLMLRLSERTDQIVRVPRCLYHNDAESRTYHLEGNLEDRHVVESHLKREGRDQAQAIPQPNGTFRVTWPLARHPLVSVIIPTRNSPDLIRRCIGGLLEETDYPNKEVILVDNQSSDPETLSLYHRWASSGEVSIIPFNRPFNYSAACNLGAAAARGDYLLFLNNDVEVIQPGWLEELVRWAQLPNIGVVGTKLVYPSGTIQHAGMILGRNPEHIFKNAPSDLETAPTDVIFGTPNSYRNVTMLTGACQLLKRAVFNEIGGYDERCLLVASDTILCLEGFRLGYRNLYTPYASLIHHENSTRGQTDERDESDDRLLFAQRLNQLSFWEDPFFHPELHPGEATPTLRPPRTPTARDALAVRVRELTAALPGDQTPISHDRSSLLAFLGRLTHHSTGDHWTAERVGRDVEAATWFVIDLLRQDEELSQKHQRALSEGVDGDFCRWLCVEGIGRYGLPCEASQTMHAAFASQPGDPVKRLIEHQGQSNPSFRVARIPSLLNGLLSWLVEHGKEHGISDRQIWWFLLESLEDPIRELLLVYDANPVWHKHFPDPLSRLGWRRLTHWIRDRYGFDATGYELLSCRPSRLSAKTSSLYRSLPAENGLTHLTRLAPEWESHDVQ